MIRFLLSLLLTFQSVIGQVTLLGGSPNVSVDTHTFYQSGTLSSCADGLASGSACQISTTFSIPNTGDAVDVTVQLCWGVSCNVSTAGTISVTDGTNTYTAVAAATQTPTAWKQYRFVACNATAGTRTLNFNDSSNDANFYYVRASVVTLLGAHASGCVDALVSNVATADSTAPSVTSAGNVSATGEVAIAVIQCNASPSNTGTYATLDINSGNNVLVLAKTGPTSGAPTTAAATCTTGNWWASLIAIKP